MTKIHPFILDTEFFFFPGGVKDLFFDIELEEMNHHRVWRGTRWWFRCHSVVRALDPQSSDEFVPQLRLDKVFNKSHCRRALGVLVDAINPDVVAPRAPLQISHFFL